ncbi:helix-turn-helix transcriptional regulator [Psychrosphaera sp. 1_MG-2023]|uniref:Helix-turn-helix transcriptional regulator n=1 Tax=Psychrosphaera algicola TaxID=3023714 RepID=A0ABT5FAL2_9GAMM|nr:MULTISPECIES: helix-turn-helix transcriptional regulator [unclassified Psychrosphaera]MDC2888578.1 helix-turn-helix transcriptional regulator [Psychrosphaera sp. G1-22]MDO6719774.1 helix-turn-helix transcriptional regulator [Psychrosphaera sp. 1_MG-2023]
MAAKQLPVANHVKELRESKRSMTQSELGEAVGVTRQTVAAIEQRRYAPSLETAFRIARVFNVGIEQVFEWDETFE